MPFPAWLFWRSGRIVLQSMGRPLGRQNRKSIYSIIIAYTAMLFILYHIYFVSIYLYIRNVNFLKTTCQSLKFAGLITRNMNQHTKAVMTENTSTILINSNEGLSQRPLILSGPAISLMSGLELGHIISV